MDASWPRAGCRPRASRIGTRAGDLGAWDKLQLGWLDYEFAVAGQTRRSSSGRTSTTPPKAQALVVVLPEEDGHDGLGAPFAGHQDVVVGQRRRPRNTMTPDVDLTGGRRGPRPQGPLRHRGPDYDYLYVQASTDGTAWTASTAPSRRARPTAAATRPSTGSSGGWVDVHVACAPTPAARSQLRFLYRTDGGVGTDPTGSSLDDIIARPPTAATVFNGRRRGRRRAAGRSTASRRPPAPRPATYDNYYIASNRTYVSFDKYLKTGPYNFGFPNTKPDCVEHFTYQHGLLDLLLGHLAGRQQHQRAPGRGPDPADRLPPEADLPARRAASGAPGSSSTTPRSALQKAESFTLHVNGLPSYIRGQDAQPLFDDTKSYWNAKTPSKSVKLPGAGVTMRVLEEKGTSMKVRIGTSAGGLQGVVTR